MLSRKRKTKNPCVACGLHLQRCICAQIPKLNLRTKLSLVIHARELKRPTNTGRLAVQALTNSEMVVRGGERERVDLTHLLSADYESYVLYPEDGAVELETLTPKKPIQLIVADGNWRQAGKVNQRHPELRHLPRVKISRENSGTDHLRKEHFATGYSTLEAIALAMGVIEGEAVGEKLLALYRAKLGATLAGRPSNFP